MAGNDLNDLMDKLNSARHDADLAWPEAVGGDFTRAQIAAAFTEWERRYREDPEGFNSEQEKLAESPETYGEACAPYFLKILEEVRQAAAAQGVQSNVGPDQQDIAHDIASTHAKKVASARRGQAT
jgi:hypothetical protein